MAGLQGLSLTHYGAGRSLAVSRPGLCILWVPPRAARQRRASKVGVRGWLVRPDKQ